MAVKMWVTRHQPTAAVRYRYAMFRTVTGRLCFTPPLHRIFRKGTFLVDETSPAVMIEPEFKWLWSTEYKDARRGAYKIATTTTSNDGGSSSSNSNSIPGGGVRIGDKQYLVPVSSSSSSSSSNSSSVPQHFLEFIRAVPAAWLLSAATDANLISLFPVKDLPPYNEKKKTKDNEDAKPGGGDFKGLQEPMWAWSIQCEDSGQAGITRGLFHPQHALRLCWDTYAIYAMACMQSGDEINVVRVLKGKLPQRYDNSTVDWQVAFRRLQVGCRLWHALLARRTHMTVDRLSSTANDVRKAVQTKLIQQSTITTSIINGTAAGDAKKKKKKDGDDEGEQQQQTTTLETILSDFVSQQTTTGRALAAINDALLSRQSSLMLNVEFWKEFVLSYCPEIQRHGQTKSEKNARVVQFARSLASLPSTDKETMEVEWKEGALELQDWSLIGSSSSSSSAAVIIPSQVISSEETPRSRTFKTVEDAVRYVRRRGFLLCAYPIVLSLGYLFPGEHIKYINRLEQPATYSYMMKHTASSAPLLLRITGKGKQRLRAQAMDTTAVSIQSTVDSLQSLIDKRLRLGALFKTYKARRGVTQSDRLPPLDYDQLAKEVTDMKFLPESKLPFYVGILETLKTQQTSLGKRGSESLFKLIEALDSRVGPALLISEYTKSLRQQIAEGGNITSARLQWGIAALMMRKGIGETQATRMIIDSTVNHVIGHPEVVQAIMDDSGVDSGDLFRQLQQAIEERSSGSSSSRLMIVDDTPLVSSNDSEEQKSMIEARQKKRAEQQAMELSSSSSDGKETKKQSVSRKPTAPSNDPFLGEEEETTTAAADGLDGLIMLSNAISASTPLPPSSDETEVGQIGKKNKKKRIRESDDDESGECASPAKRARV